MQHSPELLNNIKYQIDFFFKFKIQERVLQLNCKILNEKIKTNLINLNFEWLKSLKTCYVSKNKCLDFKFVLFSVGKLFVDVGE